MARAGVRPGKVLSSGRLTGPVRLTNNKKRTAVRKISSSSVDSGYSLYSTDSEDQVLVINKGLDRCAALLQDILQNDVKDTVQQNSNKTPKVNIRPTASKVKKSFPRKPTTSNHVHKDIASLKKSVSSEVSDIEKAKPCKSAEPRAIGSLSPAVRTALNEHVQTQMSYITQQSSLTSCGGNPAAVSAQTVLEQGPEAATIFNCRLPSSTPALSPQHPNVSSMVSSDGFDHMLPQGGAAHFPSGFITTSNPQSIPYLTSYIPAPGQQNAARPSCFLPPYPLDTLSQQTNEKQVSESDILQCIAAHLAKLQQSESDRLNMQNHKAMSHEEQKTERKGSTRERDVPASDNGAFDLAPAREIGCQTSFNQNTLKVKSNSPEKTEKKIKTIKYLLGEIKAFVADQDDGEALRLITELEHSVSLLPAVVGSTNVHAEIALALQPLRSENAQLRRRLRILNQQLRDRERAEKALRSDDQDLELTSLQSMNETLQHQLEESHRGLESLQSKNEELLKIIDSQKEENRKFARRIQEEQELLQIHQQNEIAATKAKLDIDETLGKIKSVEFKLEASEKENQILGITLRQRDAEVSRLRDLTRTLQNSMAKLLSDLSKDSSKCISGNSLTKAVLGCYEKQLQDDQCPASTSIMSYLKKLETDQVFHGASTVFSEQFIPSKAASKCVTSEPSEDLAINKGPGVLDKNAGHQSFAVCNQLPPYSPHKRKTAAASDSGTLIGDEFKPDETTYLPLTSSPFKGQFVTSQRQVCTPPKADTAYRACNPNLSPAKVSEDKVSGNSQASSDGGLKTVGLKVTSDWSFRPHEGVSTREQCPINGTSTNVPSEICPSVIQQIKSSNFSSVDFMSGKSDWSMSSFSTFTSHDEQDFRNGLAALDANIAKLQRTLQMDIIKK